MMQQTLLMSLTGNVIEVFQRMLNCEVVPEEPRQDCEGISGAIVAFSEIRSADNVLGSVSLHASKAVASRIHSEMLGSKDNVSEQELDDTIGEVLSMVVGRAQSVLLNDDRNLEISLPTVVQRRDDTDLTAATAQETVCVPFAWDQDCFYVVVRL